MAIITQRGVDRYTAALRQRFDVENEQFDRTQRLKRAASGRPPSFDIGEAAAERAVKMERLRQQDQDLRRAEQTVRGRYADGKEFQSSQRLFDAEDVSILPDAVLARHGRMAPSELVRTERDRVNAGSRGSWSFDVPSGTTRINGWSPADDLRAGRALGSGKMMGEAAGKIASEAKAAKAEADQAAIAAKLAKDRFALSQSREALQVARRRGQVSFDVEKDPLRQDTVLGVRRDTTGIPAPEFDSLSSALNLRRKIVEPGLKIQREEETRQQRASDRETRLAAQQARLEGAAAKEQDKGLKAFDKSPEGLELANLRTNVARDEQLAAKKLGPWRAAFDFSRTTGDATPEAEEAAKRLTKNRERLQELEQRRAGFSQPAKAPVRSAGGAYASPYAKEIADLERQISTRGAGADGGRANQRRLRLQAMELQDMMRRGVIDQKEADRRAAVLLGQ